MPHAETSALETRVQEQDTEIAAQRQQTIGAAAPRAKEPLEPEVVNLVAKMLGSAVVALTDGQVTPAFAETSEPVEALPADIFAGLAAITTLFEQVPEAEAYRYDIEEATASNDGLAELAKRLDAASKDKELIRAMKRPQKAAAQEKKPVAPAEENLEEFVP